jgi:nitrite reductase/ring-hydroxylating ferredoxin subunit
LSDRHYLRAIRTAEILPGGMKVVELEGRQLVICNADGSFHAIDRRCGHMNAPLELGTLDGTILTCAMHCAQFDVVTGEALAGPVPPDLGGESTPPRLDAYLRNVGMLMQHIRTQSLAVHPAKVDGDWVWVAL